MGVGSDVSWDRTFRWYVQGAHGEGALRRPVLVSARAGNINRVGFDESMYRTREQQQDGPGRLRLGLRGLDAVDRGRDDLGHGAAVLGIIQAGVLDLLGDAQ